MSETTDKNQTKKKIRINPVSLIVQILIGSAIILTIAALIEPFLAPHIPQTFAGDFWENTFFIGFVIISTIGIAYMLLRFPSIPLFIIAAIIVLVFLLLLTPIVIAVSPVAVLSWAVFFALMRQNRSE